MSCERAFKARSGALLSLGHRSCSTNCFGAASNPNNRERHCNHTTNDNDDDTPDPWNHLG